jgi:hypothetical protein
MPILEVRIITSKAMTTWRWVVVGIVLLLLGIPAWAQILTNNGGTIYLSPRAVMQVGGTYLSRANGQLTAEDSASLLVAGSMHITSGRATFNGRSIAVVDSNLTTGGVPCTVAYGYLVRSGIGTLTVKGALTSEGDIQNSATIFIWRDFVNRGTLSNSGTIEVGQP